MRNFFIIALVILSLVVGGLLIFIPHRNGKAIHTSREIYLTTSEIIEILSKVDPPFSNTDTLILENGMKLCGNQPNGFEVPLPPQPEDLSLMENLRIRAHSTAPNKKEFDRIMDTIVIYSILDTKNGMFRTKRDKIYVLVNLERSKKDGQFFIYENYLYTDTFRLIIKKAEIDLNTHIEDGSATNLTLKNGR